MHENGRQSNIYACNGSWRGWGDADVAQPRGARSVINIRRALRFYTWHTLSVLENNPPSYLSSEFKKVEMEETWQRQDQ